jgi:hypothetical protein
LKKSTTKEWPAGTQLIHLLMSPLVRRSLWPVAHPTAPSSCHTVSHTREYSCRLCKNPSHESVFLIFARAIIAVNGLLSISQNTPPIELPRRLRNHTRRAHVFHSLEDLSWLTIKTMVGEGCGKNKFLKADSSGGMKYTLWLSGATSMCVITVSLHDIFAECQAQWSWSLGKWM